MNYLINCSNLKKGGGLQVADSVCAELYKYPQHHFVIVLSSFMKNTEERLRKNDNSLILTHNIKNDLNTLVLGRDAFLDNLVENYQIDAVLTIFGPSRWNPRTKHLCGFARPHLVLDDSPYFYQMTKFRRMKEYIWNLILRWFFIRGGDFFWSENKLITDKLYKLMPASCQCFTVTNYYNQVYDHPELYKKSNIDKNYKGITCLTISTYKDYKNLEIIPKVAMNLRQSHPELKIRFILTLDETELHVPKELKDSFIFLGQLDISYCPYLYQLSDIMFMPTLLECFTASYPEAMRMGTPIITTDLEFARGLCGDAAYFFKAMDVDAATEALYKVATDKAYASQLVERGKSQLKTYDNYEQRAWKLIKILENISE